MERTPTYYTASTDNGPVYHCLFCEAQGQEHHSRDLDLFQMHMEQRHDGRMEEQAADATTQQAPADHPQGGPPGQTGDHPDHPHGGPPGQGEEHPGNPTPHPEHPIVEPDEAGA